MAQSILSSLTDLVVTYNKRLSKSYHWRSNTMISYSPLRIGKSYKKGRRSPKVRWKSERRNKAIKFSRGRKELTGSKGRVVDTTLLQQAMGADNPHTTWHFYNTASI